MLILCVSLGVGFWLQYKLTLRAAESAAVEKARTTLDNAASVHLPKIDLISRPDGVPVEGSDTTGVLRDLAEPGVMVASTDGQWRLTELRGPAGEHGEALLPGTRLVVSFTDTRELATLRHATAAVGGTRFLAVVHDPPNTPTKILWLSPEADVLENTAVLGQVLPVTSAVAALWIGCVLTFAFFTQQSRSSSASGPRPALSTEHLRQAQDLLRARDAVIFGLAKLADSRDPETGDHLERICSYSTALGEALRRDPRYADIVTPAYVKLLGTCAALHDIGKVGIEDNILRKPGPLDEGEREQMKQHTLIGGDCIRQISLRLGQSNFLHMAFEIAMSHHEWWDGTGYPLGRSGNDIPLSGRIVAIADVYDALSTQRIYKEAYPHHECVALIKKLRGTQFDPDIVDVWLTVHDSFEAIAHRYYRRPEELERTEQVLAKT